MVRHAIAERPRECCGVLVGASGEILEAVASPNLDGSPGRYLLDPKVHIDALRSSRRRGLEVVGFYHSHPHSTAEPSPRDLADVSYSDHLYLIVSLASAPPTIRAFRLEPGNFLEVPLVTVP